MAAKKTTNITVYRKKNHVNIGIIVFGAIFVYLIVLVLLYLTDRHVSAYEVREGSILKDTAYTGLVVRSETIVNAEESGYVNYFATEGSKVGAKTNVYTVSPEELNFKTNGEEESQDLTSEEKEALLVKVQSFGENFKDEEFHDIYTLKDHFSSVLESKSNQSRQAQLTDMLETEGDRLKVHKSAKDGIVIYSADGYEQIALSDITEDMITKQNYEQKNFKDNRKVNAGDPVYKLITDDIWNVVILLNDKTAKEMADIERVRVRFSKDNETAVASFQIYNTKDANLGFLTFDAGMIRYAQERYLDLELILEDESGLKIPKSSVTSKEFYIVPEDYLTQGGNSKSAGVLVDEGKDQAVFHTAEVYYRDNETGMVYLDPAVFEDIKSPILIKPDSSDTYAVYKLITDDIWNVVILLNDKTAKEMADIERVRVRFSKDNETAVASFQIYNTKDANLGFLTFDAGMIRYAQERYLDLELILEDESGLKIPKSSVTSKEFYIVPEDYLTQGGNSKSAGVLVDEGKDQAVFHTAEVYYRDNETGMVYLDPAVFEDIKSPILIKPDSSDTYALKKKKKLKGVYNINKGYAVFKQIKILCESEEYYVVEEGNDYGLANYDHIALDSDSVKENDVVFQ